jgi:osmoprotectant transport system permease protein
MVLGGALLVAALALALDGLFALLQRASVPGGISGTRRRRNRLMPEPELRPA